MGANHRNGDLPNNPQRGVAGPAACEALCTANADCKGYVWNAAGCDGGTPAPGNCFLKAAMLKANPESCSCSAAKPFPPPAPPAPPAPGTGEISISMVYSAMLPHTAASPEPFHLTDAGVVGPTAIGAYQLEGLYQGERKAFVSCVEEHYSDHESRADKTVKVNVAWVRQLRHHFGPFLRISQPRLTPHVACAMIYLVPLLTGC